MGTPYVRLCGIPQGCPFSVSMVAFITRPWIIIMRKYVGVTCYILADDVLLIGTGMKMISKFAGALTATHRYLHLMGATVAPDKSYNFASCKKARSWRKETMWKHIDSSIHVITDFRYLGAHLTTRHATSSSTLNKRWGNCQTTIKKAKILPCSSASNGKGDPIKNLCGSNVRGGSSRCIANESCKLAGSSDRCFQKQEQQSQCQPVFLHHHREQKRLESSSPYVRTKGVANKKDCLQKEGRS